MKIFDLAIAYKWIYDVEFVELIEEIFQDEGLSTFLISDFNLKEVTELLSENKIHFRAYLDRASDVDPGYLPVADFLTQRKSYIINPHQKIEKAIDKSAMHRILLKEAIDLPETILLPAYKEVNHLPLKEDDLEVIGNPFIIKPSFYTGGGEGVVQNGENLDQIQRERLSNHEEKYLVQKKIYPNYFGKKRAWFRVFWAFGDVIATWWDDKTHIYEKLTEKQIARFELEKLETITRKVAAITKLDYFSSEIAVTKEGKFYLIDYVNDQCDFRLKSLHPDGVPDQVVSSFIESMMKKIRSL